MKDIFSIKGKVALVTGGSRGIGSMIAAGFLSSGAKVYISSRKADACDETAKKLSEEYGGECISIQADVSNVEGIEALADAIKAKEDKLDILINNAGVAWGEPIDTYPEMGWDKVMDTNVKSIFFLTRDLTPALTKNASDDEPSRVINIGSIDGINVPIFETFSYSASKAAVHHLTRALASKLVRENILVNAIAPGPFPSMMLGSAVNHDYTGIAVRNPRKRVGTPEDIAGLAIFLCSRAGSYTIGETITCDGGLVNASGHDLS